MGSLGNNWCFSSILPASEIEGGEQGYESMSNELLLVTCLKMIVGEGEEGRNQAAEGRKKFMSGRRAACELPRR